MGTYYILYNPLAGNDSCKNDAECLQCIYDNTALIDMTRITNYRAFLRDMPKRKRAALRLSMAKDTIKAGCKKR